MKKQAIKNKFFFLITFLLVAFYAKSQDGKIIKQTPYVIADSSIKNLSKTTPTHKP